MKNWVIAATIIIFHASIATAQDEPGKTDQKRLTLHNDLGDRTVTKVQDQLGKTQQEIVNDAINGAASPEEYKVKDDDDPELRLKKQIVNAIYLEIEPKAKRVNEGQDQVFFLLGAYIRLHQAREAVHVGDNAQLIKVAEDMLQVAKEIEACRRLRYESAVGRPDEMYEAVAYRIQCQLRLLQLKKESK